MNTEIRFLAYWTPSPRGASYNITSYFEVSYYGLQESAKEMVLDHRAEVLTDRALFTVESVKCIFGIRANHSVHVVEYIFAGKNEQRKAQSQ